jgi:hypothetical protein
LSLVCLGKHVTLNLSNHFWKVPARVIIPVPWFYEVDQADADGQPVTIRSGEFVLAPTVREVNVKGKIRPGTPVMSYEQAVEAYKREYKRRYEEWMAGSPPVGR